VRAKHWLDIRQESLDLQGLIPRVDLSFLPWSNDVPQQEKLGRKRVDDCQHAQGHPDNLDESAGGMVETIFLCHSAR
jgi:hypothetical protein